MNRLDCLDGLRGLLALYVLLGHMAPFAILPDAVQSAISHGGAAVDLFFVLSGLVIVWSLENFGHHARPFLIARVARIFPVFLLVFAFAVLIQPLSCGFEIMPWLRWDNAAHCICVGGWPRYWAPEIAAHLTMTHGLFPHAVLPDVWASFLGAAWSLSTEWQFYVLALSVRDRYRLTWLLLSLAAAGAAWRLFGPLAWQFSRAFLPNQAHYFALGVASCEFIGRRNNQPPFQWQRFTAILVLTLAICATHGASGKLVPPLAWMACLGAIRWPRAHALRHLNHVLSHPVSCYLGAISYCVYLVNEPLHKLAGPLIADSADGNGRIFTLLWIPASIGIPMMVAAALHHWLEVPALRWGRAMAALPKARSVG